MELFPQPETDSVLPADIHRQLWERISARLERGDSLITTRHYLTALATEYEAITGQALTNALRDNIRDAVGSYNREYPERYVAQGVQNSVVRAFQSGCMQLDWDVLQIEDAGARSIARFKSRDWVRGFLKDVRVPPRSIREQDCVRSAMDVVSGRAERALAMDPSTPVLPPVAVAPEPEPEPEPALPAEEMSPDTVEALGDGTVSQGEVEARAREQQETYARIEKEELARAPERVDHFVRQGYLTTDEGETIRQLGDIDQRLASGEIDEAEASRLRNSLLTKEQRYELEKKIKGAVDQAVRFLQAFESMQRINPDLDDALRFLVFHKHILDPERGTVERGRAAQALLEDRELLRSVVDLMDRKDQEIRMISVGLPPYSYVVKRNERIGNLIIEEEFVDELRELSAEEMSQRLHSDEPEVRVRPAADIRCLIAVLNHLIKPTQWRKDVRLLRVQDTIEQFYHDTDDLDEARKQAESFLNRRLRRMFRDLTGDEKSAMEEQGVGMIDAIEQRVIAEREAAAKADEPEQKDSAAGPDDDGLTEDELQKGATIGRVEMRVAGQMRRVPKKIMRDPDDEDGFVLAQRDSETGELVPVLRRGAKRTIERGSDGYWRLTSGA